MRGSGEEAPLSPSRPRPIVAEGELNFQLDLVEGPYTVRADNPAINAADFVVGPERPSAQNDLLLP